MNTKIKKLLALSTAVILSLSFAACQISDDEQNQGMVAPSYNENDKTTDKDDNSQSENVQTEQTTQTEPSDDDSRNTDDVSSVTSDTKTEVMPSDIIMPIADGEQKELVWMGTYDLNAANSASRPMELVLFEDVCGGSIKWIPTNFNEVYSDLATAINADSAPDMYKFYPTNFYGVCNSGFFQPVDSLVDFNNGLWEDMKDVADKFEINGAHYVAPIELESSTAILYNKEFIEKAGLSDPYEMYLEGEWNWDTFKEMMQIWVDCNQGTAYGFNGFIAPPFVAQSGKTIVNFDKGRFINNISDPDIARAQEYLYSLFNSSLYCDEWMGNARQAFNKNVLFYAMDEWAYTGSQGPRSDDRWGLVPVPANPRTDICYTYGSVNAFMWVIGSKADDAMRNWIICNRIAAADETAEQYEHDKFFIDNPYWTDAMYAVKEDINKNLPFVFECGFGVSSAMGDDFPQNSIMTQLYYASADKTWQERVSEFSPMIDEELEKINSAMKKNE